MRERNGRLRIGVIGGAGFIGRRLVGVLARAGHDVRVGDIAPWTCEGARYVACDVCNLRSVLDFIDGLDVVYNLAAVHRDDVRPVQRYQEVNVGGAHALCDAVRARGIRRIVFTSSVAVYGVPDGVATEDSPRRPFNEYGRTKKAAEDVFQAWAKEDATRSLVIVRPTVVFGEGNRGNVYNLAAQIAHGRFVMVGDGRNRKSMAYVANVAAFLGHVLSLGPGAQVFNYADGPDMDMNELVSLMRERLGRGRGVGLRIPYPVGVALGGAFDIAARATSRSLPLSTVRVMKFCANTRISAGRALSAGFKPEVPLADAVDRFLAHEFSGRKILGR